MNEEAEADGDCQADRRLVVDQASMRRALIEPVWSGDTCHQAGRQAHPVFEEEAGKFLPGCGGPRIIIWRG